MARLESTLQQGVLRAVITANKSLDITVKARLTMGECLFISSDDYTHVGEHAIDILLSVHVQCFPCRLFGRRSRRAGVHGRGRQGWHLPKHAFVGQSVVGL